MQREMNVSTENSLAAFVTNALPQSSNNIGMSDGEGMLLQNQKVRLCACAHTHPHTFFFLHFSLDLIFLIQMSFDLFIKYVCNMKPVVKTFCTPIQWKWEISLQLNSLLREIIRIFKMKNYYYDVLYCLNLQALILFIMHTTFWFILLSSHLFVFSNFKISKA